MELVWLYWQLGEYISRKIASAEWGAGVVEELAGSLARREWAYSGLALVSRELVDDGQLLRRYASKQLLTAR